MDSVAVDTHAIIWALENDKRLGAEARSAFATARRIFLPSMCLVEITYLVEKRRIHEGLLARLLAEMNNPLTTLVLAPLDLGVALALTDISRIDIPDLPDRVIAATALYHRVPLISCDGEIRSSSIRTIW